MCLLLGMTVCQTDESKCVVPGGGVGGGGGAGVGGGVGGVGGRGVGGVGGWVGGGGGGARFIWVFMYVAQVETDGVKIVLIS